MQSEKADNLHRQNLVELLRGGFAPVVILLREYHYDKTGIALDGLPFSVYGLLLHMAHRQRVLLNFMLVPERHPDVWPPAFWPDNMVPENEQAWLQAIAEFELDLQKMIDLVENPKVDIHKVHPNGKTLSWAAMTNFHHNAYTIGQVKAIGRQLGVW